MKILTLGENPYILSSNAKINADILLYLKNKNYKIASIVKNLDPLWYLPDETNSHYFIKNDIKISRLYPIYGSFESLVSSTYDVISTLKPDVVISLGGTQELLIISAIRSISQHKFKWISYLNINSLPLLETEIKIGNKPDFNFSSNVESTNFIKDFIDCETLHYGIDDSVFFKGNKERKEFLVTYVCKNSSSSNIGAFIDGIKLANKKDKRIKGYLHTNYCDATEFQLKELIKRKEVENVIKLPEKYVGINDGYTESEMNEIYNNSVFVVDLSVRAGTGLSVLEGMATGCYSLTTKCLIYMDIFSKYEQYIKSNDFISDNMSVYKIADHKDFAKNIVNDSYYWHMKDSEEKDAGEKYNIEFSKKFNKIKFLEKIEGCIEDTSYINNKLDVEVF